MILVTGGTGFLGSAVLRGFRERSDIPLVASARGRCSAIPSGVRFVHVGGLGPDTDWSQALRGVEAVVHCAARAHIMNDRAPDPLAEFRRVNAAGAIALARQASAAGVRRFVFISSIKVNGEQTQLGAPFRADDVPAPEDPYGISKWEAEQGLMALAAESDMEVVVIRPPLVYGPGVKGNFGTMMRLVSKGIPLPLGAVRHNRRSLVSVDNLVDLIWTCLENPAAANEVFLAGDGEDLSTADLLEHLAEAMGRRARLIPMPVWTLRTAAALFGKRAAAQRVLSSLQVDISKTGEVLGWAPPVSVAQGLRRAVS